MLGGERVHHVEQREEAWYLHGEPGDAAGDVQDAVDGRLSHAVPRHIMLEDVVLIVYKLSAMMGTKP